MTASPRTMTLLCLLLLTATPADARSASETKLELLEAYGDPMVWPNASGADNPVGSCEASDAGESMRVELSFYIDRLHRIDITTETWGLDGYLRAYWHDGRLASGCNKNLRLSRAEAEQIWKPDLYWEKVVSTHLPPKTDGVSSGAGALLRVDGSGEVWWSRQVTLVLVCQVDVDSMPFDTQECSMTIGLYGSLSSEVTLGWRGNALSGWNSGDMQCSLDEWVLVAHKQEEVVSFYGTGTDADGFSTATATLTFARDPRDFIWSYIMPAIVLVIVSCAGFFIDPVAPPARVTLGIVTLLVV